MPPMATHAPARRMSYRMTRSRLTASPPAATLMVQLSPSLSYRISAPMAPVLLVPVVLVLVLVVLMVVPANAAAIWGALDVHCAVREPFHVPPEGHLKREEQRSARWSLCRWPEVTGRRRPAVLLATGHWPLATDLVR